MSYRTAALALYHSRQQHRAARTALREFRQKHGECRHQGEDNLSCYADPETKDIPDGNEEYEPWCDVCKGSQPLWEEYRRAANKAASDLRSLLAMCKREVQP